MNSCHMVIESTESCWIIRERTPDPRFRSRDGEKVDPKELQWRPWTQIDELKTLYWTGKLGLARIEPEQSWFSKMAGMIFRGH